MHYVGNSALIMGNNSPEDRVLYYVPWTLGSLLLPIFVIGIAFWIFSRSQRVTLFNAAVGGVFCGAAICGMHYSAQLGMVNYTNEFQWPYVLGSAVLACTGASAALGIFFALKRHWNNYWWRRGLIALVLAGAVRYVS